MDLNLIGIPATFVILCAVLLWFIILGKGHWSIKMAAIPLVLYFNFIVWRSLGDISGWPSEADLPERFNLHSAVIREPSKEDPNKPGYILIWATAIDEDNQPVEIPQNKWLSPFSSRKTPDEPRVYRTPYTQEMHKNIQSAMQAMAQGKKVGGKGKGTKQGEPGNGYGKDGSEKGKGNGKSGSLSQEQEFMLYELPPLKLPEKD